MSIATLPFTLERVQDEEGLLEAAAVRSLSYGHHVENLRERFAVPDDIDYATGTTVLLCRDKKSGEAVGTVRIQTSHRGRLLIDPCVELPPNMRSQPRAEMTRLSARPGADPLVKIALWKAILLFCQVEQVRWMIIGARNDALVRAYRSLGFRDVYPDSRLVNLPYAGDLPHRILALDVNAVERTWHETKNRMYGFFFELEHPDISLMPLTPIHRIAAEAARA
jgi:hypothetical protein